MRKAKRLLRLGVKHRDRDRHQGATTRRSISHCFTLVQLHQGNASCRGPAHPAPLHNHPQCNSAPLPPSPTPYLQILSSSSQEGPLMFIASDYGCVSIWSRRPSWCAFKGWLGQNPEQSTVRFSMEVKKHSRHTLLMSAT